MSRITIWLRVLTIGVAASAICSCVSQPEASRSADAPPSAALGLRYAEQVCAACHAVSAGQGQSPNPNAPSFEVIANLPGMTGTALNAWLHSPHPSMPNLVVSPADRDNVAAYLKSLRRGGGRA